MSERIDLGTKNFIAAINPALLTRSETGAQIPLDTDGTKTVLMLPAELADALPEDTSCAAITGRVVADIMINEDCFPVMTEVVFVSAMDFIVPTITDTENFAA